METIVKEYGYAEPRPVRKERIKKPPDELVLPKRPSGVLSIGWIQCSREASQNLDPFPPHSAATWIEKKFVRLRDEWKLKRGPESSPIRLAMHPAYLKIIGMGQDAIPFLLRELQDRPDMWFLALRSITEADPVPDDSRGDVKAMAQAWLHWGKEHGYQW